MTTAPFTRRRVQRDHGRAVPTPGEFLTSTIISVISTIVLGAVLLTFFIAVI